MPSESTAYSNIIAMALPRPRERARIVNVETLRCGTCGKKFWEQSSLDLHLRTFCSDESCDQDGYRGMLKLHSALLTLHKVISSSKQGIESVQNKDSSEDEMKNDLERIDDDEDEPMSALPDEVTTRHPALAEGHMGADGEKEPDESLKCKKVIYGVGHWLQRVKAYPCHTCGQKFSEQSCLDLHLRTHFGDKALNHDGYLSMLKLRAALVKLNDMNAACKQGSQNKQDDSTQESETDANGFHIMQTNIPQDAHRFWQICKFCGECFVSEDALSAHLAVHDGENADMVVKYDVGSRWIQDEDLHECGKCCKKFFSRRSIQRHMHFHSESIICNVCGKTLYNHSKFVVHMRIHTGERPYACDLCGKKYVDAEGLAYHKKIHVDGRRFVCHICKASFLRRNHLGHHMSQHTSVKSHLCHVCGKGFTRFETLRDHQRIHSGEKPFACPICGKRFSRQKLVRVHKTSHAEPLYECHVCHKRITTKFGLKCHLRVHTGEEPFSCDICNKTFKRKHSLVMHMKSHK